MVRGRLLQKLARGTPRARPGRRVGLDCRGRREAARLPEGARPGRVRAFELGRGQRDRRRGQRLHDQEAWPGPRHRLFADSGDVDGQLCRRLALSEPDRRRVHELLRLVLRPAAEQPAGLGRADRRAGIGRLVQLQLHHRLGIERAADAHAGRAFLHRGPLQGHEDGRGDARLFGGRQAVRHLDASEAGHRRRGRDGDGPRDPEGVLLSRRRRAQRVLRRLRAPLHRHADAGHAEGAHAAERRGHHRARPLRARVGLQRQARPGQQPGMEDGRLRRIRQGRPAQWRHRLSLGTRRSRRPGPMEPRGQGSAPRQRGQAQAVGAGRRAAEQGDRQGRLPVFRRHRQRALPEQQADRCAGAHGARAAHRARQGRRKARGAGGHGVRPAGGELWRRARPARRNGREELRRRHAVHAGLAGAHHRHAARAADHRGATVRRERPQDARQVDGHHRRGDEPLVPQRHELPRRHQHADDVRLHRPERRRLGALRRPGKAAAADRLDGARVRARLDPPAAADEQHQLLLRAHRPVALREAGHGRSHLAARRQEEVRRQHDRLQRARRADGLAALGAAAADESAAGRARCAGCRHRPEGLCGQGAQGRHAEDELHRPGPPGQLAAQPVRLAVEPAGLERQGPRVLPQAPARHQQRRAGKGPWGGGSETYRSRLARQGARRQARPAGDARLPHEHDVPVLGHRAAHRHVVREERPQHQRHASVHPPAVDGGGSGLAIAQRLGHLQGLREEVQRSLRRPPGRRARAGADAADARQPLRAGPALRRQGLEARRVRADPGQDRAQHRGGRARLPERVQALHRAWAR